MNLYNSENQTTRDNIFAIIYLEISKLTDRGVRYGSQEHNYNGKPANLGNYQYTCVSHPFHNKQLKYFTLLTEIHIHLPHHTVPDSPSMPDPNNNYLQMKKISIHTYTKSQMEAFIVSPLVPGSTSPQQWH